MPDTADAPVPDQGLFSRAIGVIVSPGETFRTIAAYPRPATFLFVACLVIGLAKGLPLFSPVARQVLVETQTAFVSDVMKQPMTPERVAQFENGARTAPYTTVLGVFVFGPVTALLFTGVFWAVFNAVLGGTASFKQVLGVVAHAQAVAALGEIAAAPLVWLNGSRQAAGPFNLGALVPMMDPKSPVAIFLTALGVFPIWQFAVTGLGLGVLYGRRTTPIALALVCVYALIFGAGAVGISSTLAQ